MLNVVCLHVCLFACHVLPIFMEILCLDIVCVYFLFGVDKVFVSLLHVCLWLRIFLTQATCSLHMYAQIDLHEINCSPTNAKPYMKFSRVWHVAFRWIGFIPCYVRCFVWWITPRTHMITSSYTIVFYWYMQMNSKLIHALLYIYTHTRHTHNEQLHLF